MMEHQLKKADSRMAWILVLFCFTWLFLPATMARPATDIHITGLDNNQLQAIMTEARNKYNLPSLQVAVVYDTTIIFSDAVGYADLTTQTPATSTTVYRVGSVTKPITATMLVKLVEEGVVRLDDPVARYIPEYSPRSRFQGTLPTTLRQLATHQSGLPPSAPQEFLLDLATYNFYVEDLELNVSPMTREDLLQSLSRIELAYPPYSPYGNYSNLGYRILGIALERASGKDFATYVTKNIFHPLGMNKSAFDPAAYSQSERATGYVHTYSGMAPRSVPVKKPDLSIFSGGMYSTAEDLCRFLSLQFQESSQNGRQIISAESLRMMQWTAMDWGFSFDARYPALQHGGGVPGFRAHVIFIPGLKIGLAVLSNRSDMIREQTPAKDIAWFLIKQMKPGLIQKLNSSQGQDQITAENYTGTYILGDHIATIKIVVENGRLYSQIEDMDLPKSALYESSPGNLCYSDDKTCSVAMHFDKIKNGRPGRLSIAGYHFLRSEE